MKNNKFYRFFVNNKTDEFGLNIHTLMCVYGDEPVLEKQLCNTKEYENVVIVGAPHSNTIFNLYRINNRSELDNEILNEFERQMSINYDFGKKDNGDVYITWDSIPNNYKIVLFDRVDQNHQRIDPKQIKKQVD